MHQSLSQFLSPRSKVADILILHLPSKDPEHHDALRSFICRRYCTFLLGIFCAIGWVSAPILSLLLWCSSYFKPFILSSKEELAARQSSADLSAELAALLHAAEIAAAIKKKADDQATNGIGKREFAARQSTADLSADLAALLQAAEIAAAIEKKAEEDAKNGIRKRGLGSASLDELD
ncbi:hypothetical protein BD410DRAFT_49784 [Rickenella mellea]|uniref:Uncharacterized protein n=1 Tax=Rickenella mellea TaxID=50990 RepID=A0A4R5XFS8_9AGAM|nr:hypothetical protein BD410DRAFT_49784 [Rickenella mellea]